MISQRMEPREIPTDAPTKARRLLVSAHALERAVERIPGIAGHPNVVGFVFREVQLALAEGRIAKTEPRWLIYGRGPRVKAPKKHGVHRYVWPASETHAYLLVRGRAPDGTGSLWIVRTVLERHRALEATA